jgi:ribosomal protein S18 acetylase RimI-like enzyme
MTEPHFRPARKDDCRKIAELYRISSDGVVDYVWTKLAAPGEDILDAGCRNASLIVFEQNGGAARLYRRLGYVETQRERVVPHPLIHHTGDALLMVKQL